MKVVVSGYVGKKVTGIGRHLISLLDNVSDENEYIVYTNGDLKKELIFQNPNVTVKTYQISKNSSIGNLLWTTFVFPRMVRKEKADATIIPNFTLLLFKARPTVVFMCDLIEFNVPGKFSPLRMFYRKKLADPITAKRADRIVTSSQNSKNDIVKFLGINEDKIALVNSGVDQNRFQGMSKAAAEGILSRKGWPDHYILYAGTVDHPGKNAMAVVKAFETLKETEQYDGSCVLAGMPGSGFEYLKEYIDHSIYKEQIIVTGYVSDEELIALYSRCDTFVFVSLYEGFGIPPLEALACGAKVVVSSTSSLPEAVGEVGIKVDPTNQEEITAAVKQSLEMKVDEDYQSRVKAHLDQFDWKIQSCRLEDVLKGLRG